ncbi:TonB family protein [Wenzhouxiangella sp. EGI_FJ10305]|uniref:TonB family protein n=1 Tax=Wenzhouxiangella sp. EGI_FJ10305 TaxID=3243768 RepID=UPI0035DD038D
MPNYPRHAAIECLEGEVLAQFTVSESLEAENVKILRATPSGVFEQVVLDALARWSIDTAPGTKLEKLFKFDLGKGACSE